MTLPKKKAAPPADDLLTPAGTKPKNWQIGASNYIRQGTLSQF